MMMMMTMILVASSSDTSNTPDFLVASSDILINTTGQMMTGRYCIKLWLIASLGCVQVVGFFDVAERLCSRNGPIAALLGGLVLVEDALQHCIGFQTL